HPTLSEALPEALLDAVGMAIHKARRPAAHALAGLNGGRSS
ncbi:MAG: hypothetical protein JWN15_1380, partial [Firmicutes bacterium]|nr:hypothetical protein [Bacillota bacterium]